MYLVRLPNLLTYNLKKHISTFGHMQDSSLTLLGQSLVYNPSNHINLPQNLLTLHATAVEGHRVTLEE